MSKRKAPKSWAEEIAETAERAPRGKAVPTHTIVLILTRYIPDFDPEEIGDIYDEDQSDSDGSNDDQNDGRDHYESVG
jgi:hypothetical protein